MSEEADNHHQSAKPRPSLLALFGAALAVLVSSVIAFCCTCFPVGLAIVEYGGGLIIHDTEAQRRTNECFLLPVLLARWWRCSTSGCLLRYSLF